MNRQRNRVLMLLENCSYPRDSRVRHEAQTLTQNGYRVSVIGPNQQAQPWHETVNGVHVYRFPAPPPAQGVIGYIWEYLYSSACIFALSLWVFLREGVDIVHVHNPPDVFFVFAPLLRLWGIAFVYDHHDLTPELFDARFKDGGSQLLRRLLIMCEVLSYKVASHVIVTNESYRQIALERGHVPSEQLTIVRNGPDNILPIEPKNHNENVVVYVGSMGFHDGVDYLLRALHGLINTIEFRNFRCVLAGNGDAFESLKLLAAELKITAWVEFRGWLSPEDVQACLSIADVCAAPEPLNDYNDHSTMIKVMEYMAAGKPIVAFDLTEQRRTASRAALYARPNDVYDYARQIMFLIEHPQQAAEMGQFGQQRIVTELAWHFQADALLKAYHRLHKPSTLSTRTLNMP
jgi:glycosyltransferase involved in cell wall biosynthesis